MKNKPLKKYIVEFITEVTINAKSETEAKKEAIKCMEFEAQNWHNFSKIKPKILRKYVEDTKEL